MPGQRHSLLTPAFAIAVLAAPVSTAQTPPPQAAYYCGAFDPGKLTNVVYVSATGGTDGDTCGASLTSQCKSIARGIANCRNANANCSVLVAYDRYPLSATIAAQSGVHVYGGCALMPRPDPFWVSLVIAPPDGKPAFSAANLNDPTTIQGFAIFGTPGKAPERTSIAFSTSNTAALTLSHLTISAANGAAGANGSNGTVGSRGGDAGTPPSAGWNQSCADANGGAGGTQWTRMDGNDCAFRYGASTSGSPGSTGQAAAGGGVGNDICYRCPKTLRPSGGGLGLPGAEGTCGTGGIASTDTAGSLSDGTWVPSAGGTGGRGGSGGGGGGGGAGGGCGYTSCWSNKVTKKYDGRAGGGGGAGGCGGTGGNGGMQGGASFALLVDGGTVFVRNSTIIGATGGTGGAGGAGEHGGNGGSGRGSLPANPCNGTGGAGGTGGNGGMGGSAGGGAGGNGGPAIGIAETPGSNVTVDATTFYTGTGGQGGLPGRGGDPQRGSPRCKGRWGQNGAAGLAEDQRPW